MILNKQTYKYLFTSLVIIGFFTSSCSPKEHITFKRKKNNPAHVRYPKKNKQVKEIDKEDEVYITKSADRPITSEKETKDLLISFAQDYVGIPYIYAGKTPNGFDCSGYTSYIFNKVHIKISPSSKLQSKEGTDITLNEAQRGDLVFFGKNNIVSHVAIVVDKNKDVFEIIHATSSKGVMQQDIMKSKYWYPRILFARRVF